MTVETELTAEQLIQLYALEEAIDFVIKGLELSEDDAIGEVLGKLFHNRINDNDLSMDQYKTLKEGYKNPQKKAIEDLPPAPFPWVASAGHGWSKKWVDSWQTGTLTPPKVPLACIVVK